LQPVPDNSNPLYIRLDNPDLKQELTHTVSGNLYLMSPFRNKNFMMYFSAQSTQNKIVNYDVIDSVGIRTTRPVNVNGVYSMMGDVNYSLPVRFLKGMFEVGNRVSYNHGKQFINTFENTIKAFSAGPEISISASYKEKFNISFEASLSINKTNYSLQSALNTKYLQQRYGADLDWEMPKRFFFATDFSYTINTQRAAGFNAKIPIWNASFSKLFMKYNRGEIKISAFDLLNKNIGINRTSNLNYIEDSRVNTLQRFFMLSFTYSLTKSGLSTGGDHGGGRVIMR
jgi:hypothetical protein